MPDPGLSTTDRAESLATFLEREWHPGSSIEGRLKQQAVNAARVLVGQQEPTNAMIQAAAIVLWEKGNERLGVERDREIIGEYVDEAEATIRAAFAAAWPEPEGEPDA